MILLIDNYDSFTYNLVQRIGEVFLGRHGGTETQGHDGRDEETKRLRDEVNRQSSIVNRQSPLPPIRVIRNDKGDARLPAGPEGYARLPAGPELPDIRVVRNDKITVEEAAALNPTHLILSPGPCTPTESGICPQLIEHFMGRIPILGVCLGHQTIGHVRGMTVSRHHTLMHGKTSEIFHDGRGIYTGLSNPFTATRYHSLIVERDTVPDDFEVSAWTAAGEVMGLRWRGANARTHKCTNAQTGEGTSRDREGAVGRNPLPGGEGRVRAASSGVQRTAYSEQRSPPPATLDGVQFHPESFLTVEGPKLLANFLGVAVEIHR